MATVNYSLRSKNDIAPIYVRFVSGRNISIAIPLNILINPKNWDKANQKIRNVITVKNRDEINRRLILLKAHIFDQFSLDYTSGEVIDKSWLERTCNAFFNRPKHEKKGSNKNSSIYYTDFALFWLEEKSSTWLVGQDKYMPEREINKYKHFIGMVQEYQGKDKLKLKDISSLDISDFVKHLADNHYASKTIQRHIGRFKFFLNRAEELQLTINPAFKQRVFTPKSEPIKEPYLNPEEIEAIYKQDFSDNESYDNVRDNLIIAVWTGLRVSDFLGQLNISNFIDDEIQITTQKTNTQVVIPLHPMVKRILIKRKGKLPKKISDQKFNKYVKEVCKKVGIKEKMKGGLYDKKSKRKVFGDFEKWKLISSHIGRRSFATNHYGKIPDSVIMGVCGWSQKDMMLKYIKKSNREHAVELKKYWDEIYS